MPTIAQGNERGIAIPLQTSRGLYRQIEEPSHVAIRFNSMKKATKYFIPRRFSIRKFNITTNTLGVDL